MTTAKQKVFCKITFCRNRCKYTFQTDIQNILYILYQASFIFIRNKVLIKQCSKHEIVENVYKHLRFFETNFFVFKFINRKNRKPELKYWFSCGLSV